MGVFKEQEIEIMEINTDLEIDPNQLVLPIEN
jgi:hypothetical protein